MITERDLDEAIAACQGKINPNANDCVKLAAFYTIRKEMFGSAEQTPPPSYSFTPAPAGDSVVSYDSGSEFSRVINGRQSADVWAVIDELMDVLNAINPRLYNATISKIER